MNWPTLAVFWFSRPFGSVLPRPPITVLSDALVSAMLSRWIAAAAFAVTRGIVMLSPCQNIGMRSPLVAFGLGQISCAPDVWGRQIGHRGRFGLLLPMRHAFRIGQLG